MGVSCLVQVDIPEDRTGQQILDALQKKIELAGASKTGSWFVECDSYVSSQNSDAIAKIFYLMHCSDYPSASFTVLENDLCVVADQSMDSLLSKLKAFYVPKKAGKTEAKGISYDSGDFKIKVGNMSQGNNFRGVIVEFEYCPCCDIAQCWELLMEFAHSFIDERHCQVQSAPKSYADSKTKCYSIADKMLQYVEMFKFSRKTTSS